MRPADGTGGQLQRRNLWQTSHNYCLCSSRLVLTTLPPTEFGTLAVNGSEVCEDGKQTMLQVRAKSASRLEQQRRASAQKRACLQQGMLAEMVRCVTKVRPLDRSWTCYKQG